MAGETAPRSVIVDGRTVYYSTWRSEKFFGVSSETIKQLALDAVIQWAYDQGRMSVPEVIQEQKERTP